jgi:regulator of protease activity HflC (stomatin/prohibitin superfamily)
MSPPEYAEAEFERLINELEESLAAGGRVPFSRRLMIEEEKILDIIDRMRVAVPDELRQARQIVREREQLIEATKKKIALSLSDQGLLEIAQRERARIIGEAEAEAARIRAEADDYSRQVLLDLEERIGKALTIVQNGLDELGVV